MNFVTPEVIDLSDSIHAATESAPMAMSALMHLYVSQYLVPNQEVTGHVTHTNVFVSTHLMQSFFVCLID
jgi:hypothetical protein